MDGERDQFNGDTKVLHQQAVRTPLPDKAAERVFYENMMTVADAQEQKAALLADPEMPLLVAYEEELDAIAESFERRLRQMAGDDYEEIAMAYFRGERDDRLGELTAYYLEGLWRIQQGATITDMMFSPVILRYPESFTVNIRFTRGYATTESVYYESPAHCTEELDDEYATTYYEDCLYSQQQAATYLKEAAQTIREQFPDPDDTSFDDRKYGGIVSAGGRRGPAFSAMLEPLEPDPNRFSEPVDEPTLVDAGPEAKRTERELLCNDAVVL